MSDDSNTSNKSNNTMDEVTSLAEQFADELVEKIDQNIREAIENHALSVSPKAKQLALAVVGSELLELGCVYMGFCGNIDPQDAATAASLAMGHLAKKTAAKLCESQSDKRVRRGGGS